VQSLLVEKAPQRFPNSLPSTWKMLAARLALRMRNARLRSTHHNCPWTCSVLKGPEMTVQSDEAQGPITSKRQQHKLHLRVASWGDCSHHTLQHKPNLQLLLRSCAYRASKSESLSEPTLHYGLLSDKSWSFLPESPGCGMTVPDKSVSHFHWTFLLDRLCYLHLPSTCASKMAATSGDQQWLP